MSRTEWQPIETAPAGRRVVEIRVTGAAGYDQVRLGMRCGKDDVDWAVRLNSRYKHLGWVVLNETHQPVAWRDAPASADWLQP